MQRLMKEFRFSKNRYELVLTPCGTGQSFFRGLALNRWSGDPLDEGQGFLVYLHDRSSGESWSATPKPCLMPSVAYEAFASDEGMGWEASHQGIGSRLQAGCAESGQGEVRRLELTNKSSRPVAIEVTSYLEVVLHYRDADVGHPAFQKLFVQTEWDQASGNLLAHRRARGNDERWPWLVHRLAGAEVTGFETDRLRFLGRGRDAGQPAALGRDAVLSQTVGNVLDACLALRTVVEVAPGETRELSFFLGIADTREEALGLTADVIWSPNKGRVSVAIPNRVPAWNSPVSRVEESKAASDEQLTHFNGYGGFSADGSEYVIRLPWQAGGIRWTPLPWVNVIANPECGLLVSESGSACTWARNSQANRLTPWNNDPVSDPAGESLYVRDEEDGRFWSPLPGPVPMPVSHEVRHGWGYSTFVSQADGLNHEVTFFVPKADPVRIVRWTLRNAGGRARRLSLVSFARLVLGNQVPGAGAIPTQVDGSVKALTAAYPEWSDFRGRKVFAAAGLDGRTPQEWHFTCDRRKFLGEDGGGVRRPAALRDRSPLSGEQGSGLDACFAQQILVSIEPAAVVEVVFLLGEYDEASELNLEAILNRYRQPGAVAHSLAQARDSWREILGGIHVRTPVPELDVMLNGWLAYQAMVSRMIGRNAFYQSSGAYGFRDQLQDAHGMAVLSPELTRAQILRHAARQFGEGDVMHWWHPEPINRGLRTRFSDDLLWLPFVTAAYAEMTGDATVWKEQAPFLSAEPLAEGQDENYLAANFSGEVASIYEHCCRAIDRSLATGEHGLPLMGTGDWNDGMNRIGRLGKGESVWMAFFLCDVLQGFAPWCEAFGETERAQRYREHVRRLQQAIEVNAWDGNWYRRAYYDDGTPLGTASADECRIDGLAQSWAVISGAAQPERAAKAMQSAWEQLVDAEHGLVRLLTPPFVHAKEDPGYIKGYVAGVRENGGQYTHAACWFVKALAMLGRREQAGKFMEWLTPVWHSRDQQGADHYKVEPYVIAADIYHGDPLSGRGGWTWYTGSAAWCFRVAVESILGFRILGGSEVVMAPRVPDGWKDFSLRYRSGTSGTVYDIRVANPAGLAGSVRSAALDGVPLALEGGQVRFALAGDGGAHRVDIVLG